MELIRKKQNTGGAERPKLTIIVPHYNEPISIVDKLFRSINDQRQIEFNHLEIIVVNDCGTPLLEANVCSDNITPAANVCSDNITPAASLFGRYPNIRIGLASTERNGGVGAARQRGIDLARGEYIMIVDCDDVLASPHALFRVLAAINEKPETDLFHFNFIEEHIADENYMLYQHDRDITFCHGKVYKRAFLISKNIKCHPTLRYNEDSYFNALIYAEAEKIEYIDENVVVWCYNKNSTVRAGGLYAYKELPSYIMSMSDLTAQLLARKKPNAKTQFLYGLFYTYFSLQDEAWESKRVAAMRPAAIEAVRAYFKRYEHIWDSVGSTERLLFYSDCRKGYKTPIMERQTLNDFIKEIRE
jgi:glycosyltransferase involved in cell wall biosynthesis